MGKKGKKAQAGKPKKLTPKDVGRRLNVLVRKFDEELKGADLFAPVPPKEDCPICFVPLSRINSETGYQACCGNIVCVACYKENEVEVKKQNEENGGKKIALTCPFCRELVPTSDEEGLRRIQARCLQNDHHAFTVMGNVYRTGVGETPQDDLKALDCWIRAVEHGSPEACVKIGKSYREGNGVAIDKERAALFERVGALRGSLAARYNIGLSEYQTFGNYEVAIRHWKIAAEAGYQKSLNALKKIYNADGKTPGKEFLSKEYLESTYRACHEAQMEVASEGREKHRAFIEWPKCSSRGIDN